VIRTILQLGNPALREKSSPITAFNNEGLKVLIEDLSDTLQDAKRRFGYGRGIAAPQIGELKRVVFINMPGFKSPLVNPRITCASDATFEVWDSCYSFSVEFFVLVERHRSVEAEYSDLKGSRQVLEAEGELSGLLQHEIDHLDGVLATDRMKDRKGIMMRSEWEKTFKS